jgi:hypothetical protein
VTHRLMRLWCILVGHRVEWFGGAVYEDVVCERCGEMIWQADPILKHLWAMRTQKGRPLRCPRRHRQGH